MKTIVGAYATAPRPIESDGQFRGYVDAVLAMPGVDGLEVPFYETESPWNGIEYLHATPAASRHVLTLVPALVIGMAERPLLGLASNDETARRDALAVARHALEFIHAVNAGPGGRFDDIELHSSPRRADGSADALACSLDELAGWDWGGVQLTIEHCDTDTGAHPPAKGYLPLPDELAVAQSRGVGIVLNWGRSAIETRSAAGALSHIEFAAPALAGVIFSGVSPSTLHTGPAGAISTCRSPTGAPLPSPPRLPQASSRRGNWFDR